MAYPTPAERDRIVSQRNELFEKLLPLLLRGTVDKDDRRLRKLIRKYGEQEVDLILDKSEKLAKIHERIGEQAAAYREYRRAFARFGGDRPFLSKADYERLSLEFNKLTQQRQFRSIFPFLGKKRGRREQELYDLLLLQVDFWEDITPPAPPARPAEFDAPPARSYGEPARRLLAWGWSEEVGLDASSIDPERWQEATPELVQIVFDEGLLQGWPADLASWAPYHALHMLGQLQTSQYAGDLLALLGRKNDWLSDQLPLVWGRMGPAAEAILRVFLGNNRHEADRRSYAMLGLKAIAEEHPRRRAEIIKAMVDRLQRASAKDATANGYLTYVLTRMQAEEAKAAIDSAFTQKKVDTKIIRAKDVPFLDKNKGKR